MSTNRDTSAHDTYWRLRTLPSRSVPGCPANEQTYRSASAALTVGAGILRIAYLARVDFAELLRLQIPPLRWLDVCAIGILVWLRTKWRRSIKLD